MALKNPLASPSLCCMRSFDHYNDSHSSSNQDDLLVTVCAVCSLASMAQVWTCCRRDSAGRICAKHPKFGELQAVQQEGTGRWGVYIYSASRPMPYFLAMPDVPPELDTLELSDLNSGSAYAQPTEPAPSAGDTFPETEGEAVRPEAPKEPRFVGALPQHIGEYVAMALQNILHALRKQDLMPYLLSLFYSGDADGTTTREAQLSKVHRMINKETHPDHMARKNISTLDPLGDSMTPLARLVCSSSTS